MIFKDKFKKLEKQVGFGKAVAVLADELPRNFWRTLDKNQLSGIYYSAPHDSPLREKALRRYSDKINDYNGWVNLKGRAPYSSCLFEVLQRISQQLNLEQWLHVYTSDAGKRQAAIRQLARKFIKKMISTESQLIEIYKEMQDEDKLGLFCFRELKKKEFSFKELLTIFSDVPLFSKLWYYARNNITRMAVSFNEWYEFCKRTQYLDIDENRNLSLAKMAKLARSFNQWKKIYFSAWWTDSLRDVALRKMLKLSGTFDEWKRMHDEVGVYGPRNICLKMMKKYAKTFDQWETIAHAEKRQLYGYIDRGTLDHMRKLTKSIGHWEMIYDLSNGHQEIQKQALKKMKELAV